MTERFLDGRVALVTGATRGIGHETALLYARAGAHVVALGRTVGGLEELDDAVRAAGAQATLVPLDLRDGAAIDRLAPALAERFGRMDLLFAAAAEFGPATPVGHMKPDAWDATLALNLSSNWRLLRALDPLLRASDGGRALFATCTTARAAPAYASAYAASKAGLEALVRSYAKEIARTPLRANLVLLEPVATRLRLQYAPGEARSKLLTAQVAAAQVLAATRACGERNGQTWDGARDAWL